MTTDPSSTVDMATGSPDFTIEWRIASFGDLVATIKYQYLSDEQITALHVYWRENYPWHQSVAKTMRGSGRTNVLVLGTNADIVYRTAIPIPIIEAYAADITQMLVHGCLSDHIDLSSPTEG